MSIVDKLLRIAEDFVESEETPELTMHDLVSTYNKLHDNSELIGGDWIRENVPSLANLP